MLDKNRIDEANANVCSYLREGLLKKTIANEQIMGVLLKNGKESLRVADEIDKTGISDLWIIVCSYYSMYSKKHNFLD